MEEQSESGFQEQSAQSLSVASLPAFWTPERDKKLKQIVQFYGQRLSWNQLSAVFPGQTGKRLKERYYKHLDPDISTQPWTEQEDRQLRWWYIKFGQRWHEIARHIGNRSPSQIKNRIKGRQFRHMKPQTQNSVQTANSKGVKLKTKRIKDLQKRNLLTDIYSQSQSSLKMAYQKNMSLIRSYVEGSQMDIRNQDEKSFTSQLKSKIRHHSIFSIYLFQTHKLVKTMQRKKSALPQFFQLFDKSLSKKQIIQLLKKLQWILLQFWPLLQQKPFSIKDKIEPEISCYLYLLIKSNSQVGFSILQQMLKCEHQSYATRQHSNILANMKYFNETSEQLMKDEMEFIEEVEKDEDIIKIQDTSTVVMDTGRESELYYDDVISQQYAYEEESRSSLNKAHLSQIKFEDEPPAQNSEQALQKLPQELQPLIQKMQDKPEPFSQYFQQSQSQSSLQSSPSYASSIKRQPE